MKPRGTGSAKNDKLSGNDLWANKHVLSDLDVYELIKHTNFEDKDSIWKMRMNIWKGGERIPFGAQLNLLTRYWGEVQDQVKDENPRMILLGSIELVDEPYGLGDFMSLSRQIGYSLFASAEKNPSLYLIHTPILYTSEHGPRDNPLPKNNKERYRVKTSIDRLCKFYSGFVDPSECNIKVIREEGKPPTKNIEFLETGISEDEEFKDEESEDEESEGEESKAEESKDEFTSALLHASLGDKPNVEVTIHFDGEPSTKLEGSLEDNVFINSLVRRLKELRDSASVGAKGRKATIQFGVIDN